jgi:4-hydroxy-tetrahydrodipicolinate reductase
MGRLVIQEAQEQSVTVGARIDIDTPLEIPPGTEVLLDFSSPDAWSRLDRLLKGTGAALVSGTTGLSPEHRSMLRRWSLDRAVFYSANMSAGIFVLNRLAREAFSMLGDGFDMEIVEIHHREKADSPSGTAAALVDGIPGERVYGRHGRVAGRPAGEIGVHSLRGGDVAGEHQVHLLGDGERLCLTHCATGRKVFALGALRAAFFVLGRKPGLYGMEDLLGGNP